jgi:hypothetical protein
MHSRLLANGVTNLEPNTLDKIEACTEHIEMTVRLLDEGALKETPCYDARAAARALRELVSTRRGWGTSPFAFPVIANAARLRLVTDESATR